MPSTTSARQPSFPARVAASTTSIGGRGARETTDGGAHRVDAQVGPGRERAALRERGEGSRRRHRVGGSVEHDRGDVEQHALQRGGQVVDGEAGSTDLHQQRGDAVLQVGQRGGVGSLGVRVGEQRPDVPAVAARGRADRVGQVGHQRGGAQRSDPDAVQGAAGEPVPDLVVGIVVRHAPGLAEDRRSSLLPDRHVLDIVGCRQTQRALRGLELLGILQATHARQDRPVAPRRAGRPLWDTSHETVPGSAPRPRITACRGASDDPRRGTGAASPLLR